MASKQSNGTRARKELDMSNFKSGQLNQLGDKLEASGWTAEDITRLGQASKARLDEIRLSLSRSDIILVIEAGKTELWLHEEQKTSWVNGRKILAYLTENSLLAGCADLDELEIIQAQGIEFFRKHFKGRAIFGWRGVQDDSVPCLIEGGNEVVLRWRHLDCDWDAFSPALRRK